VPVIVPPPHRSLYGRVLRPLAIAGTVAAIIAFLIFRFGDTPLEKAEKLFQKRDLKALRNYAEKNLETADNRPLFYSYFAVAEFSTNSEARLASLLNNIRAVDGRVIFRRDALARVLQISSNQNRLGEILTETIGLEERPGPEIQNMISRILALPATVDSRSANFPTLAAMFPEDLRRVAAKKLQFRANASTEGEVLRQLEEGEILLQRSQGPSLTVSGKRGHWTYALDTSMKSGWVFDAYLKRPKETAGADSVK
jgi:hypothetical protein